jgi:hypothetical protein
MQKENALQLVSDHEKKIVKKKSLRERRASRRHDVK